MKKLDFYIIRSRREGNGQYYVEKRHGWGFSIDSVEFCLDRRLGGGWVITLKESGVAAYAASSKAKAINGIDEKLIERIKEIIETDSYKKTKEIFENLVAAENEH